MTSRSPLTVPGALLVLLAVLIGTLGPRPAAAQETTATVTGTVVDQTGALLPAVAIDARNVATGIVKRTRTTDAGRYTLPFLPSGEYELRFSLPGFRTHLAPGLRLHVNDRRTLDVVLSVAGRETAVEVVPVTSAGLDRTPGIKALMGPTQVQELPLNNRNFVQLATLVPGVSSSLPDEVGVGLASNVSLSFAGARRNAINWLVDGASNVDVGSNITLLSTPTLESIEEFKILTSTYPAEWPRSGGGVVNVVTKSGSNVVRASAYEYFRDDSLNANSFFRKQSSDPAIRDRPPTLRYHNFGLTLGGPLLRDRLFAFGSLEWREIDRASSPTATTIDPRWLTDPASPNYVPPAERDANAVALLAAWPAPNSGDNIYVDPQANEQNTRQAVLRVDWNAAPGWRVMARYTHDRSETTEPGGLFYNTAIPDVAATRTTVPGKVFVAQVTTTLGGAALNQLSYQYSGNVIDSRFAPGARSRRTDYGLSIPELFPENRGALIPFVSVSGLTGIGANQPFENAYRNHTLADTVSLQRGTHALKAGLLVSFEAKDEISTSPTQGTFTFAAGGGRTAFQNFLTGNRDGACGSACSYSEPQTELLPRERWNRYEMFAQDSWRATPALTLDVGLRWAVYPGVVDEDDVLTNFVPTLYSAARTPEFASEDGSLVRLGTGDPLNGIVVAGRTSPHGRRIHPTRTGGLQPRLGFAWDRSGRGRTLVHGGFGVYYDQPLVGIFFQNAFTNPPFNASQTLQNPALSSPAAGTSPTTAGVPSLQATSDDFALPRTLQWSLGVQRALLGRATVSVSYVGSRGSRLIQPVNVNQPQPADVAASGGALNLVRPYLGYGTITMRQTTGRSTYHGLLAGARYDAGRAATVSLSYTLGRAMATATNDRDTADLPQNPLDLEAEWALARTDRTHVFTGSWVVELPFFRSSQGLAGALLRGWQLSGIVQLWSGTPLAQVANGQTDGGRRGSRTNRVGDPFASLPPSGPGYVYWFDPAAFAPPPDGSYGNSGRAPLRVPGVNQWDLTVAKGFTLTPALRLQLRADLINAFNHTQLGAPGATCSTLSTTSCFVEGQSLGRVTGTRSPREIQLGVRLTWN